MAARKLKTRSVTVADDAVESRVLPGDLPAEEQVARMIRVDHAGEYGARRIYQGQLAVLGRSACAPVIRHMAAQEEVHLKAFEEMIAQRRVRPTALMPLWHAAGYLLGAGTALLGKEAAMACTVAVESVIDEHYAGQEKELGSREAELRDTISLFRAEEMEHHAIGLQQGAEKAPAYPVLSGAIRTATKMAIWLSTRV